MTGNENYCAITYKQQKYLAVPPTSLSGRPTKGRKRAAAVWPPHPQLGLLAARKEQEDSAGVEAALPAYNLDGRGKSEG